MNVFLDTEFTTLDQRKNPKLISIGIVDQLLARTFYAEITDSYHIDQCEPFVIDEVLPLLDANLAESTTIDPDNIYIKATLKEVKQLLKSWIMGFHDNVQLYVDAPHYDMPMLKKILGKNEWISNLNQDAINVIPLDYDKLEVYEEAVQNAYDHHNLNKHHALDDARAMRIAWLSLEQKSINEIC